MPSGGKRIGSGRKPKNPLARVLRYPANAARPVADEVGPVEAFPPMPDLTADARLVWDQQAPFGFAHRTLTRASALAFGRYCELVVLERRERASVDVAGTKHRGLLKELRSLELQFLLAPCGRAMPIADQAVGDPDEAFFAGSASS